MRRSLQRHGGFHDFIGFVRCERTAFFLSGSEMTAVQLAMVHYPPTGIRIFKELRGWKARKAAMFLGRSAFEQAS